MTDLVIDEETRRKQRQKLESRSVASLETRYAQQNREELEAAERSMAPPVVMEPRCHVCQSPRRLWIERQLMKGRSYKAIADSLPPEKLESGGERIIDRRSISSHYNNGHMPLDEAVMRAVMEEEASLLQQNWEEGVRGAFTNRGALNTLIRKAYDDAMAGVTTVEPRDLVQMIKLYNEMDTSASLTAVESAKVSVRIYTDAIQTVIRDRFDTEEAAEVLEAIREEVRVLRSLEEIEADVEGPLRTIPERV